MNRSRFVSTLGVLAIIAMFAMPAAAQQAVVNSVPLDEQSEVSSWYYYDYFGYWNVDSSPIAGHDGGNSLNCNDGNGLDYLGYNWMEIQSAPISFNGAQNPILTWWCMVDLPSPAQGNYMDSYLNMWDGDWNNYLGQTMGMNGWEDHQCSSDWHQHSVAIPPTYQNGVIMGPYIYFEDYYYNAGNQGWFVDEIKILGDDSTPPDAIIDLDADNATLTEIELTWTSPVDDDVSGVAASFDLRMSTSPITVGNFANATQLNGEPNPDAPGTVHTVLITNLDMDTTYYFAVQSTDFAGNVSALSNVPSLATLAPPPPPPQGGNTTGKTEKVDLRADDVLPCSAGSAAAPTGLLALAGLIAVGFALRRKA